MNIAIDTLQKQLLGFIKDSAQPIRLIRKPGEPPISKQTLLHLIETYHYSLRDVNRIVLCAKNSVQWIALLLTCLLYNKELYALDKETKTTHLQRAVSIIKPEIVLTDDGEDDTFSLYSVEDRQPKSVAPDLEPKLVLFTTGTTGEPRGVVIGLDSLMNNIISFESAICLTHDEAVGLVAPFSHAMGLTMMLLSVCFGGDLVISSCEAQTLNAIISESIDVMAISPIMVSMLQRSSAYVERFRRMRCLISGGAGLSRETYRFYNDAGVRLINGYGMTECCPVIAVTREGQIPWQMRPLDWCEVKVSPQGELLVRGSSVCKCYYDGTRIADENGWFHTRDIVEYEDGNLTVLHRMDNVHIMKNGYKLSLENLENRVMTIRGILDCRAFVRISASGSESLHLEISVDPALEEAERAALAGQIAKVQHYYERVESLTIVERIKTKGMKKVRYETD